MFTYIIMVLHDFSDRNINGTKDSHFITMSDYWSNNKLDPFLLVKTFNDLISAERFIKEQKLIGNIPRDVFCQIVEVL